ncbi:hypothetical protein XF36_29315 [Pseudonocardia sp. HH130629-09]|nr:hypothetical protein XF36_29315 [Pseudonocardia sp. HH130629-09]
MNKRSSSATRMNGPARTHVGRASRPPGREFQALAWTARHPGFVAVPLIVLGLVLVLGPVLAAILLGALAGSVAVWGRAHPATFDRFAAPALRATWRRWTVYRGRRWTQLMSESVFETGRRVCAGCVRVWSIVEEWLGVGGGTPRTPAMSSGR